MERVSGGRGGEKGTFAILSTKKDNFFFKEALEQVSPAKQHWASLCT